MNWRQPFHTVESWIEKKKVRFAILFLLALFGLWAGPKISACLVKLFSLDSNLEKYLDIFTISVFVLTALWYFRTYDTRQQINQNDLFNGLNSLASDNPVRVDIGVAILLEISKKVPSFNKTIKVAFVRRLKNPIKNPKIGDGSYLSYAQHILRWLINYKKKNKNINFNLDGMDLSHQEFSARNESEKIIFEKLFDYDDLPITFSLYYADPHSIDFITLNIKGIDDSGEALSDILNYERDKVINNLKEDYCKALICTKIPADYCP